MYIDKCTCKTQQFVNKGTVNAVHNREHNIYKVYRHYVHNNWCLVVRTFLSSLIETI